tara:strand:+ start:459 stop:1271 length:813 start_codon:yes stop_codon:yes gene_type:complete
MFTMFWVALFSINTSVAQEAQNDANAYAKRREARNEALGKAQKALRSRSYHLALKYLKKAMKFSNEPVADDHYNLVLVAGRLKQCKDIMIHTHAFARLAPDDQEGITELKAIQEKCLDGRTDIATLRIEGVQKDATITIDDIVMSQGPLDGIRLLPGKYKLNIKLVDHVSKSQKVVLKKGASETLTITLEKITYYGSLNVITTPTGVNVSIDGVSKGKTPLEGVKLEVGKHFVELTLPGYDRFIRNVHIRRDQVYDFDAVLESTGAENPK